MVFPSNESAETTPFGASFIQTFRALRHRNFRYYWIGLSISLIGTWMQTVALSWLAYDLTASPFMLGLINVVALVPVVPVSLFAGVISDRFSRKTLSMIASLILALQALALALLTWFKVIDIWQVMILSFILGAAGALEQPARMAMVSDMVGKEDLANAVALNASIFNLARIIGPSIAGLLVAWTGEAGCFAVNAAARLAVVVTLFFVRVPFQPKVKEKRGTRAGLMGGFRYVWNTKAIRSLMTIVAVTSFFSMSYVMLATVFASDILKTGPAGVGFLMTAVGIGAIVGALLVASLREGKRGRWLMWGNLIGSAFLIAFCFSRTLPIALALILAVGISNAIRQNLSNSLLQIITPEDLQGRVMSIFNIFFNSMSRLGNMAVGGVADFTGVAWAVGLGGAASLIWSIIALWQMPEVRRLA
jgi:MFS family permease